MITKSYKIHQRIRQKHHRVQVSDHFQSTEQNSSELSTLNPWSCLDWACDIKIEKNRVLVILYSHMSWLDNNLKLMSSQTTTNKQTTAPHKLIMYVMRISNSGFPSEWLFVYEDIRRQHQLPTQYVVSNTAGLILCRVNLWTFTRLTVGRSSANNEQSGSRNHIINSTPERGIVQSLSSISKWLRKPKW